jgi:hypothetical protein
MFEVEHVQDIDDLFQGMKRFVHLEASESLRILTLRESIIISDTLAPAIGGCQREKNSVSSPPLLLREGELGQLNLPDAMQLEKSHPATHLLELKSMGDAQL